MRFQFLSLPLAILRLGLLFGWCATGTQILRSVIKLGFVSNHDLVLSWEPDASVWKLGCFHSRGATADSSPGIYAGDFAVISSEATKATTQRNVADCVAAFGAQFVSPSNPLG